MTRAGAPRSGVDRRLVPVAGTLVTLGLFIGIWTVVTPEIEAALGLKLRADGEDEEIDTIGGLVFLRAGRVPVRGEVVDHESGAEIEIVDADPRRIKRLRIRLPAAAQRASSPAAEG